MKRIALIGFGDWGCHLARVLFELRRLRCICDLDLKKIRLARERYHSIELFQDIADSPIEDIDAVVIATPPRTHYALAEKMLNLDKDVFIEKPLALSVKEGEDLVKLAKKKQRILMVGHILQYHPAILKLKAMIDSGYVGNIRYIYSNRLNIGRFRKEENILWSFAPHDISLLLFLLKDMPEYITCSGGDYLNSGVADITISTLSFKNDMKAHIFVSWLHPFKEQKLVVIGDKKMVVFDDIAPERKLVYYDHKINVSNGNCAVLVKDKANAVPFEMAEPLRNECREFIHCIENRIQPLTDGRNGLRVLKVLEACQLSLLRKGLPVKV